MAVLYYKAWNDSQNKSSESDDRNGDFQNCHGIMQNINVVIDGEQTRLGSSCDHRVLIIFLS